MQDCSLKAPNKDTAVKSVCICFFNQRSLCSKIKNTRASYRRGLKKKATGKAAGAKGDSACLFAKQKTRTNEKVPVSKGGWGRPVFCTCAGAGALCKAVCLSGSRTPG